MSDTPRPIEAAIDPTDPLLEHFAFQHDFRERYQHALEEILKVNATPLISWETAGRLMIKLAAEALDIEEIRKWQEAGRPLPWIDETINPVAERVRDDVLKMLGLR